jgi:hypothetical protein
MLGRTAGIAGVAIAAMAVAAGCASSPARAPIAVASPVPSVAPAPMPTAALEPLPPPLSEPSAADAVDPSSGEAGAPSASTTADSGAPVAAASTPELHVLLVDEPPFRPEYAHPAPSSAHPHARKRGRHGRPYHPAARVVVDVSGADHDPAAATLQREVRNLGYWPFRTCFEEGLRRSPDLGGTVTLRIRVAPEGLASAGVVRSTLGDPVVVACMAREAAHVHWATLDRAGTADVLVTLGAGDEPVFVPPPVHNAPALRQALREPWSDVERCFSDGLAREPDAGGRMQLRFRVAPGGTVAEVAEAETRFRPLDVTQCVLGVYRARTLPVAASRDETFVYALHFESPPDDPADLTGAR